jgi:predicted CXXCH cytochrome family protein
MRTLFITALLLITTAVQAQLKTDSSKECVICHVSWGEGFSELEPQLKAVDHPLVIDGQAARVSSEAMCWSCHDAYVSDSRRYFLEKDPHMQTPTDPEAIANTGMPLANDGQIYCGTCHTPHGSKMEREYSFSPFQRMDVDGSALCITCHAEHATADLSHPIHAELKEGLPASLAGNHVSEVTVECMTCHEMHTHQPLKLSKGNDHTDLCASCHQAEFDLLGSDHQVALDQPNLLLADGERTASQVDACAVCHTTHGAKGKDLWAWDLEDGMNPVREGVDARCLTCHNKDGAAKEKAWKDHGHTLNARVENCTSPELPLDEAGYMSCTTCHNPHRWSRLADQKPSQPNTEGTALSSFLRLADDQNGSLCTSCHEAQAGVLVSDHNSFSWKDASTGQCSSCHNTHEPTAFIDQHSHEGVSAFTSLCLSCHEGEGQHGATPLGAHGHSLSVEMQPTSGLPGYDSKTLATLDATQAQSLGTSGSSLMVGCETCHDPHVWSPIGSVWQGHGSDGNEASSFLVMNNTDAGLCVTCHEDEAALLTSSHDVSAQHPGESACRACHATHQAATDWADLRQLLSDEEMLALTAGRADEALEKQTENWSPGARHCLSCHQEGGESQYMPESWAHPQKYETLLSAYRGENPSSMPLFGESGRADGLTGRVDCLSCHNPHVATSPGEGESTRDYLRQASHETVCADCHGEKALWKYRYYHNTLKREMP